MIFCTLSTLRMASPALGPTPDTPVSRSNISRSSRVANPNSETSFSVMFMRVYTVHVPPTPGSVPAVVDGTATKYPTPAQSTTTESTDFSRIFPVRQ